MYQQLVTDELGDFCSDNSRRKIEYLGIKLSTFHSVHHISYYLCLEPASPELEPNYYHLMLHYVFIHIYRDDNTTNSHLQTGWHSFTLIHAQRTSYIFTTASHLQTIIQFHTYIHDVSVASHLQTIIQFHTYRHDSSIASHLRTVIQLHTYIHDSSIASHLQTIIQFHTYIHDSSIASRLQTIIQLHIYRHENKIAWNAPQGTFPLHTR